MNKYSPHEALGKTLVNPAGERLQFIGGGFILCFRPRNLASPSLFPGSRGGRTRKQGDFDTLDLHVKGAPRPRKGIIPPCSGVRP